MAVADYVLHTLRVLSEERNFFNRVEPRINFVSSESREDVIRFLNVILVRRTK